MYTYPQRGEEASDRWSELFIALSAKPRRMLLYSLLKEPPDRRLPLPDAAETSTQSMDSEELAIKLRHQHLPLLHEMGYVTWEDDPFCVQRGPKFEEAAFILGLIEESIDDIPWGLAEDCHRIAERVNNGAN